MYFIESIDYQTIYSPQYVSISLLFLGKKSIQTHLRKKQDIIFCSVPSKLTCLTFTVHITYVYNVIHQDVLTFFCSKIITQLNIIFYLHNYSYENHDKYLHCFVNTFLFYSLCLKIFFKWVQNIKNNLFAKEVQLKALKFTSLLSCIIRKIRTKIISCMISHKSLTDQWCSH